MNIDIHSLSENLSGEVLREICFIERTNSFTPEKHFTHISFPLSILNGAERKIVEDLLWEDVDIHGYMNDDYTLILQHDSDTNLIIVCKDGYIYSNSDAKKDYGWKRAKVWE